MKREPKPAEHFKPQPVVPLTGRVQFTAEQLRKTEAETKHTTPF